MLILTVNNLISDGRGLKNILLIEGAELSTMAGLTSWVAESDKVLTF